MKLIFSLFAFLITSLSVSAQVRVPGVLTNGGNAYPVAPFNMIQGSPQIVADMTALSNAPSWLRSTGQLFHVLSPASDWRLIDGTNNSDLRPVISEPFPLTEDANFGGWSATNVNSITLTGALQAVTLLVNNLVLTNVDGSLWTNLTGTNNNFTGMTNHGLTVFSPDGRFTIAEFRNSLGSISYLSITDTNTLAGYEHGLVIGYNAGGTINNRENTPLTFGTGGEGHWRIVPEGHFLPIWTTNDLGDATYQVRKGYFVNLVTSETNQAAYFVGNGAGLTLDASGFNGNLTTGDNTLQEVAQKLDDLTAVAGASIDPRFTSSANTITSASNTFAAITIVGTKLFADELNATNGSSLVMTAGGLTLNLGSSALTLSGASGGYLGIGGGLTLDASGFNGNLTTGDNTLQEVAQKLDDLSVGGGGGSGPFTNSVIGYGDAQHTNALVIGPGGLISSNAAGSATFVGGNQTNSGHIKAATMTTTGAATFAGTLTGGGIINSGSSINSGANVQSGANSHHLWDERTLMSSSENGTLLFRKNDGSGMLRVIIGPNSTAGLSITATNPLGFEFKSGNGSHFTNVIASSLTIDSNSWLNVTTLVEGQARLVSSNGTPYVVWLYAGVLTTNNLTATGSGGVSDGDKGDITVSSSGTVWNVDANSIALTTDTTGNYAAGDAEAGAALTGDSATAFFSSGTLEPALMATNAAFSNAWLRATSATTAQWSRDGSGLTNIAGGGSATNAIPLLDGNGTNTHLWSANGPVITLKSDTMELFDATGLSSVDWGLRNLNGPSGLVANWSDTSFHVFGDLQVDGTSSFDAINVGTLNVTNFNIGFLVVSNTASIRTNIGQFDVSTTAFVIGTRYTNSTRRAFVTASFQLSAAAAGTAAVSLRCEQSGVTNRVNISAGPLASLSTVEQLSLMVGPDARYYFVDDTSGTGASVSIVAGTSSRTDF